MQMLGMAYAQAVLVKPMLEVMMSFGLIQGLLQ